MLTAPAVFKSQIATAQLGSVLVAVGAAIAMALTGPTETGEPGSPCNLAIVAPGTGAAA